MCISKRYTRLFLCCQSCQCCQRLRITCFLFPIFFSGSQHPSKALFIPLCVNALILHNPLIFGNFAYIIQARI